jgi:hypothetical protein
MRLAHLEGANMTEATYNNETQWMSAKYTKDYKETKWPHEGFDPEAEGCILVEENVEIEIPKAKKK